MRSDRVEPSRSSRDDSGTDQDGSSAAARRPPQRGPVADLQDAVGNRAVARILSDPTGAGSKIRRQITFDRFGTLGVLSNWGFYSDDENTILDLARRLSDRVDGLRRYRKERRFMGRVAALEEKFGDLDGRSYSEDQYPALVDGLRNALDAGDKLSVEINDRDQQHDKTLDANLGKSFDLVEEDADRKAPNQVTADELSEIRKLLDGIYRGEESNLKIQVETPFATFDLYSRADSLGLPAPPELQPLELRIASLAEKQLALSDTLNPLIDRKWEITTNMKGKQKDDALEELKSEMEPIRAERDKIGVEADKLKDVYNGIIEDMVKEAVLVDLVSIAQTGVGRDLLKEIAQESLAHNAKTIVIRGYDQFVAATAGEESAGGKNPYVNYTPQPLRDRDTKQREVGGAITTAENLAKTNKWQENARTDIGLFHELVHTQHYQSGTAKTDNKLVSTQDAVHDADRPRVEEDETKGVREEEYYTVGLGQYRNAKYTENKYRDERRNLGEKVNDRSYYTHVDEEGNPISL